jgi:hypothetical protein
VALCRDKRGNAHCATVTDGEGAARFHLTVERDGIWWNWIVQDPGKDEATVLHGRTVTRHGAMWDAERATLL